MKSKNEDNIKELEVDKEIEIIPVEKKVDSNGGNSFYERSKNSETIWYKDWRGKALVTSLAALILLGAAIPSGMAAAGYWKGYKDNKTPIDNVGTKNDWTLAQDEISRLKDTAINLHYEKMVEDGWISQTKYNKDIENIEENAQSEIDSEIDALKKQYGNNGWEEEWDKTLQSNGFHTSSNNGTQEYKDSKIADQLLLKETNIYSSTNTITEEYTENSDQLNNIYFKSEVRDNKILAVSNSGKDDKEIVNSFTPQDLVGLYLWSYQPEVFNKSTLTFTLDGENPLEATSLTVTFEDLKNAKGFYDALVSESGFEPAAEINNGIQSKHDINLGEPIDNATVINALAGNGKDSTFDISLLIENSFKAVWEIAAEEGVQLTGGATFPGTGSITPIDLEKISGNTNLTQKFEIALYSGLHEEGVNLITDIGEYRDFATITTISGIPYVMYVSATGLNLVGKQIEGTDLVVEQLNNENNVVGSNIDYGLFTSFSTWLVSNYENILLLDYLTDSVSSGWINTTTGNPDLVLNENFYNLEEEYTWEAFLYNISSPANDKIILKYKEISDFYDTNWKIYNNNLFNSDNPQDGYSPSNNVINWLTGGEGNENHIYSIYEKLLDNTLKPMGQKNKVFFKRGDN